MRIVLAVSGCIAAYKTPDLVRRLRDAGHEVRCMLTASGARLVAPQALATVSGHRTYESLWEPDGSMPHIDLARWCEAFLIAPATASTIARCAQGQADDLISTTWLALERDRRCFVAPAMNTQMWTHPAVAANVATIVEHGATIIEPASGDLACGEQGVGALADAETIVAAIGA